MSLDKIISSGASANTILEQTSASKPQQAKVKTADDKEKKAPIPTKKQVELALKNFKSTRVSYVLTDEVNRFIVKIIDNKTDKVIKQIPSEELQKLHENLEEALGILFDQEI